MKEFIEKLKSRLEKKILGKPTAQEFDNGIYSAIKIVNQLAEEYINTSTTNADKIRSMTDEDLAEFLCKLDTMGTEPKSLWNGEFWIDEGEELLNWLQSEVEGE